MAVWCISTKTYGVASCKAVILIFPAVKTQLVMWCYIFNQQRVDDSDPVRHYTVALAEWFFPNFLGLKVHAGTVTICKAGNYLLSDTGSCCIQLECLAVPLWETQITRASCVLMFDMWYCCDLQNCKTVDSTPDVKTVQWYFHGQAVWVCLHDSVNCPACSSDTIC